MSHSISTDVHTAKITLLRAIDTKFSRADFAELYLSDTEKFDAEWFYSCQTAPNCKTVFFVKLIKGCPPSLYCPLVRKRSHKHKTSRGSYTVNVFSNQVISMCFSKVCKTRNGGKFLLRSGEEESSSEEEDYDSGYDSANDDDLVDLGIIDPNATMSPTPLPTHLSRKRMRESL